MSELDLPDLSISDEKLCFIIAKAREGFAFFSFFCLYLLERIHS